MTQQSEMPAMLELLPVLSTWTLTHVVLDAEEQTCEHCNGHYHTTQAIRYRAVNLATLSPDNKPTEIRYFPRSEVVKLYSLAHDVSLAEAFERYVPKLPRKVLWHKITTPMCFECFDHDHVNSEAPLRALLVHPTTTREYTPQGQGRLLPPRDIASVVSENRRRREANEKTRAATAEAARIAAERLAGKGKKSTKAKGAKPLDKRAKLLASLRGDNTQPPLVVPATDTELDMF